MPLVLALLLITTVLTGCAHHAEVRPARVVFACGDGNFYATGLSWTHWGTADAEATGAGHALAGSETLPCRFLKLEP